MNKNTIKEYVTELEEITADVNPSEIKAQIDSNNLDDWCKIWSGAVKTCIKNIKESL